MKIVKVTKTDEIKESEGVWVNYGEVELLIARFPTDLATKAINQLRKAKRKRDIDMSSRAARRAMHKIIAERVLLDWKGVKAQDGDELIDLPYTLDNCLELLKVDTDLVDFVSDFSLDIDNYMQEEEDKTVGE